MNLKSIWIVFWEQDGSHDQHIWGVYSTLAYASRAVITAGGIEPEPFWDFGKGNEPIYRSHNTNINCTYYIERHRVEYGS